MTKRAFLFIAIAMVICFGVLGNVKPVRALSPAKITMQTPPTEVWVDPVEDESLIRFKTIQAAVNAVAPGGVVRVNGATYNLATPITINKPLYMLGIGSDTESPLINGRIILASQGTTTGIVKLFNLRFGVTDGAITIGDAIDANFDQVELNQLTFGTVPVADSRAIQTASSVQIKQLSILGCTINAAHAVDLSGDFGSVDINYNTINLTAQNAGSFDAIRITQDAKASASVNPLGKFTIQGNTLSKPSAEGYPFSSAILNQTSFTMTSMSDAKKLTVSGNTFGGITDQTQFIQDKVAAFVPVLPVKNLTTSLTYATIQAAVDAASNNDILEVGAGIYTENLTINKPLTIKGSVDTNGTRLSKIIVTSTTFIYASNVTFDSFDYSAPGANGIFISNGQPTAGLIYTDVTISNNYFHDIGGSYGGNINAIKSSHGVDNLHIINNIFDGVTNTVDANSRSSNAITIGETNSTDQATGLIIRGNTFRNISAVKSGAVAININNKVGVAGVIENNIFVMDTISCGATCTGSAIEIDGLNMDLDLLGNSFTATGAVPTNNVAVGVTAQTGASLPKIQFKKNLFDGGVYPGVVNLSTTPMDAMGNWWGSASGPTAGQTVGNVLSCGWLLAPTGDTVTTPVTNTNTGESFCTIQAAIDDPETLGGHTITVAAGTYAEDLVIDKSITLLGPNAAINPNSATRIAEAILVPATSQPDPNVCEVMAYIEVSNVTIKGFTLDGDNPNLTSGVMIGSADVDACEIISSYEGVGNIVIENDILQNATYAGIDFYNYTVTSATSNNYIRYNTIQNIGTTTYGSGMGILVYNNFYADITDNVLDNVRIGIQTGNFSQANVGSTGSISSNVINAWRLGIFHNMGYASASPLLLNHNTISALPMAGQAKWVGMLVSSFNGAGNATITGNTINISDAVTTAVSDYAAGYDIWNNDTTLPLVIHGGMVTGGDYGVFVNNWEGYSSAAGSTAVTIDGMTITGAETGLYVKDNPLNTSTATVKATILNNTITATTGIKIEGDEASAQVNNNAITGGAANLTAKTMDASGNWWGSRVPADVKVLAGMNVDFTPWLDSGTDIDGIADGFQGDFSRLHVDDDSPQFGTVGRIQEGVNLVSGSTVLVEPGEYLEAIFIDKNLELLGAGASTTKIVAPASQPQYSYNGGTTNSIIEVSEADVNITGFTIDGAGKGNGGGNFVGVHFWKSTNPVIKQIGSITNCVITGVRDEPISGMQDGIAIQVNHPWDVSYPQAILIQGNTIKDYQKAGIVITELDASATVTENTITGAGPLGVGLPAQNGVQIGYGATGNITDNVITNNKYTGPDWSATGIIVVGASNVSISGNTLSGNGKAIDLGDDATYGYGNPNNINVSENSIADNDTGIYLTGTVTTGNVIEENEILDNVTGIFLDGSATAEVRYNRIFGNTANGLTNNSTADSSATNNWWGCNAGPANPKCDLLVSTASGTIDADPWLTLTAAANPQKVNPGDNATLNASLLVNSAGLTPSTAKHVPDTTPVGFSATAGTMAPTSATTSAGLALSTFTAASTSGSDDLCVEVDNEKVCKTISITPALMATDFGYMNFSNVLGVTAGFKLERTSFAEATKVEIKLYSGEKLLQTNTAILGDGNLWGSTSLFSAPFDIFGAYPKNDGYWVNVREVEYGQTAIPTCAEATVTLTDATFLTSRTCNLTGERSSIILGSLVDTDFGYWDQSGVKGVSFGFRIVDNNLTGASSMVVKLYADEAKTELLQTNTAILSGGKWDGLSVLSSPFDIFGAFPYEADGYWQNFRQPEYGQTKLPVCAIAEVTLFNGKTITAERCNPTGDRNTILPGRLVAEDFSYIDFSNVLGVTAGFKLDDAILSDFSIDDAASLVVKLYSGTAGDQLLQTNTANLTNTALWAGRKQFSGPFDIFGTFNYAADANWTNLRETEYGQTAIPTRVVATVTLKNGKVLTAENTMLAGNRLSILPKPFFGSNLPSVIETGKEYQYDITLDNPMYGASYSNVRIQFRLLNTSLSDITSFKYLETGVDPAQWMDLKSALVQDGPDLVGWFGPSAGFPLPTPRQGVSSFKLIMAKAGDFTSEMHLYDVKSDPDVLISSYTGTAHVVDPTLLSTNLPAQFLIDSQTPFTVTLNNPATGIAHSNVRVKFRVESISAEDITSFQYLESTTSLWTDLPFIQDGTGVVGWFGPTNGFPLPAPYTATSQFRVTIKTPGSHTFSTTLVEVASEPDLELAKLNGSFDVVDIFNFTDFGLWGPTFPGGLSLGWAYTTNFNPDRITAIEVGMLDAAEASIVTYTADAEQITWQKANGYITDPGKLSSTSFYTEYKGIPLTEGRDLDWTVTFGTAFSDWNPGWAYVKVSTTDGLVQYKRIAYTGPRPDMTSPTITGMIAKGVAPYSDVAAVDKTFAVPQGYVVDTIEIVVNEPVTVAEGTIVKMGAVPYGELAVSADGLKLIVTPYAGNEIASLVGTFTFSIEAGSVRDLAGQPLTTLEAILDVFNVAPVAVDDSFTVAEDDVLTVPTAGVLSNDTDFSTDHLIAVSVSNPTSGTLALNADGSFTYSPNKDFNGTDTFIYKANDGAADSSEATVTITVNPVNDAPVADAQTVTTDEDSPFAGSATGSDVDKDTLTFSKATDPSNGTVVVSADGTFTYTPSLNFNGADSFTFTVSDGTLSDIGTINITVIPVNDAPIAQNQSVTTAEDTAVTITPVANDLDLDALTYVIKTAPAHGTAVISGNVFIYTPELNFNGEDSFTFAAKDASLESEPATITIIVTPVKDSPVAVADAYLTNQDTQLIVSAADGVLKNDNDVDLNNRDVSLVTNTTKGTLTLNTDGSFIYTPNAGVCGADTFTYRLLTTPALTVAGGWTDEAVVTIKVNCPPALDPIPDQVAYVGELLSIQLHASDPDGDPLTFTMIGVVNPTTTIHPETHVFTGTPTESMGDTVRNIQICVSDGIVANPICQPVKITVEKINPANLLKYYFPIMIK